MSNAADLSELMAFSMDAEVELLPYLPQLFLDLEDLGCQSQDILDLISGITIPAGASALDLGCGKGAVALALAREHGLQVLGIDGMAAFLEHAGKLARESGLEDRCQFRNADLREVVKQERGHDLVCLLALGDVLGDLTETVAALRECVIPGGIIIIDDAYLDPERAVGMDLSGISCHEHQATLEMLTHHGDRLLVERVVDGPESKQWYLDMLEAVEIRAAALCAEHPSMREVIEDFVDRQRKETELLLGPVVGAIWLLQRGS